MIPLYLYSDLLALCELDILDPIYFLYDFVLKESKIWVAVITLSSGVDIHRISKKFVKYFL